MTSGAEAQRDQDESSFTRILRALFQVSDALQAAIFVDDEGECIDYCSAIEPYEIKVAGAQLLVVANVLRARSARLAAGEVLSLQLCADDQDYVLRFVSHHYALIAVVTPGGVEDHLLDAIEDAATALRTEAGIARPYWDPSTQLNVQLRTSLVWDFAPASFDYGEGPVQVMDVMGRWEELFDPLGRHVVCFRIRTYDNVEMTLAYDFDLERWLLSDEYRI